MGARVHKDLFYFQPHNLDTLDWGKIYNDISISSPWYGFSGLRNIAVEFDPRWAVELEKDRPYYSQLKAIENLADAAIDAAANGNLDTLWLIDYGIKRKHHVPTKEQAERHLDVFYLNDRRLVEVRDSPEFCDSQWQRHYQFGGSRIACSGLGCEHWDTGFSREAAGLHLT
ncbi:hypothetical protein G7Z17_g10570 [Cylindrodendrum hubeiense]|uniref:Uncharacterized protein n=1 Tax=Cylindrodendrum hubeiense TaxID=595255 RepID=A0A9P5H6V8_9HYPO|nr:hypothetical protein G7Z17_g10570 [Cylindrodendrum hubeiense]